MKKNVHIEDKYAFVCLGKKNEYYYKQIGIIEVVKFLCLYNKIFGQRFRINYPEYSLRWLQNLLYFKYRIIKKNFIQFIRVLKYKFRLRNDDGQLNLRHYGQYCIVVNKGYKIFNFKKKAVKKKFRSEISKDIFLRELKVIKKSQITRLSPKLIRWNVAEKWYEEELVRGNIDFSHYPRDTNKLLYNFKTITGPALQKIIFSSPPQSYPLSQIHQRYAKKINEIIVSTTNLNTEIKNKIRAFTRRQIETINKNANPSLFFSFSHGDFCPANIVNTSGGISLIDWEGAAERSILFDFYSYLFYRPVHQIFDNFDLLIDEIKLTLNLLVAEIQSKFEEIQKNISEYQEMYRRIYYFERIIMLAERINEDEKLNIKNLILDFINAFEKYDSKLHSNI